MFFVLSKIFEFVAAPSHLALLLAVVGVSLINTRFWKWGGRLAVVGVALLLLMALGLGDLLAVPLETRFPAPGEKISPPDGVIVLGGSVDPALGAQLDRVVLNEAAERLVAPIAVMRRFPKARLVFTGGSGSLQGSRVTEAAMVKRFWRQIGLDQGEAIYEDRSRNTYENAIFTRDRVKPKAGERWLLVTSAMHMPRAVGVFRRAGFTVIPYPVDYRTNGKLWPLDWPRSTARAFGVVDAAAHEWVGLAAYWATGKSDALFPGP